MYQPCRELGQLIIPVRRSYFDGHITAIDITRFVPPSGKRPLHWPRRYRGRRSQACRLLPTRRERPRGRRAAEQRDEVAALQWIELHRCPPARPDP